MSDMQGKLSVLLCNSRANGGVDVCIIAQSVCMKGHQHNTLTLVLTLCSMRAAMPHTSPRLQSCLHTLQPAARD